MRTLFIIYVALGLLVAGCGSKGPLYIPEKQYPQPQQDSK